MVELTKIIVGEFSIMDILGPSEEIIKQSKTEIHSECLVSYTLFRSTENGRNSYSIRATENKTEESVLAEDVTHIYNKAIRIFELICEGGVPPYCLIEIIEDLIETIPENTKSTEALCHDEI